MKLKENLESEKSKLIECKTGESSKNSEGGEDQSYKESHQMVLVKATSWKFEFFLISYEDV